MTPENKKLLAMFVIISYIILLVWIYPDCLINNSSFLVINYIIILVITYISNIK